MVRRSAWWRWRRQHPRTQSALPSTPAYIAPEHILGQPLTPAADVFALGVLAQFAATGELAFGDGSAPAVTHRIVEAEPNLDGCTEPIRTSPPAAISDYICGTWRTL